MLNESDINEAINSLKETQRYCTEQMNVLKQQKYDVDDLRLLINVIFSTDADLYISILTILKQGSVVSCSSCIFSFYLVVFLFKILLI